MRDTGIGEIMIKTEHASTFTYATEHVTIEIWHNRRSEPLRADVCWSDDAGADQIREALSHLPDVAPTTSMLIDENWFNVWYGEPDAVSALRIRSTEEMLDWEPNNVNGCDSRGTSGNVDCARLVVSVSRPMLRIDN